MILAITKHLKSYLETFITKKLTVDDAEAYQIQFDTIHYNLNKYSTKNPKYIVAKNIEKFYEGRNKIIEGFKNNIFLVYYNETQVETSESDEKSALEGEEIDTTDMSDLESEKSAAERNITKRAELRRQRFDKIATKEKKISVELFERYFGYLSPRYMYKSLNETKNSEENKVLVNIIENNLTNLIKEIKSNPKSDTKRIKNRNDMLKIVELILYFNQQNQAGKGLQVLTPNQMLSRLPIFSAWLKAGNNSEKLKNEITQILYSLYRSKKIKVYLTLFKTWEQSLWTLKTVKQVNHTDLNWI